MNDDVPVPWKRPKSIYGDDGADCDFEVQGHRFRVRDAGIRAIDTGRKRWTVSCMTCGELIHTGSTSAHAQVRSHLRWVKP